MRNSSKLIVATAAAAVVASLVPGATRAADYTWGGATGTQDWTNAANWGGGFPNAASDTANLSVGLGGNLGVNLPGDITVGTLSLGGTTGPVTTDIGNANAGGGRLILNNGGSGPIINSNGVAGSVNTISAPVRLEGPGALTNNLQVDGANSLTINSVTQFGAPTDTSGSDTNGQRWIQNNLAAGATLTINNITLTDPTDTVARRLELRGTGTYNVGTISDGISPPAGVNGGYGTLTLGLNTSVTVPPILLPRYVITGNNTGYTGTTIADRGTIVFGHDNALGTGELRWGNPSNHYGFNIESTDDARVIPNNFRAIQNTTYRGEHSITWGGWVYLTSNRDGAFMNLLPAGKTLTFNGPLASSIGSDTGRRFSFDGPGMTVVNSNMYNHRAPYFTPPQGSDTGTDTASTGIVIKNGTGTVLFNGTGSTYDGQTIVSGGYLQFASPNAYGLTTNTAGTFTGTVGIVVNRGGAIGVLTGSTTSDFLGRFGVAPATVPSTGGLALATADATANIDFTGTVGGAVNLSGANVVGMSIGAVLPGTTYTGTITPAAAGYRLGGGGTLTLPNTNALTGGGVNVSVVNGGTVAVTGANNYTGVTTIKGDYVVSMAQRAAADNNAAVMTGDFLAPTLAVSQLAPGGSASGIGAASNAASNLVISGGTFKYTGAAGSTDRLFTIGSAGATLDASGTGAVNFTNTGAIVSADVAAAVTGSTTTGGTIINSVNDISELTVGMTVSGGNLPDGTTIVGFQPTASTGNGAVTYAIRTSANATTAAAAAPLTFGTQNRKLTLTGSNTGNNTIAGVLSNSATGTLAVDKTGAGKWVLGGANTYTGGTTVNAGTLSAGHGDAFAGGALTVANGAVGAIEPGTTKAVTLTTLNTNTSGKFDVTNNAMVIKSQTDAQVRTQLQAGYNGGAWNGATGIVSSAVNSSTSVGYASNTSLGLTEFKGVTGLTGTDVIVKYTYAGDANLDGKVDIGDLGLLAGAWQQLTGKVWFDGDFTYDGAVNIGDLGLLAGNWQKGTVGNPNPPLMDFNTALAQFSAFEGVVVPEPASLSLLALGGLAALGRRRRRSA